MDEDTGNFHQWETWIHVDERCFFFVRDEERAQIFPDEQVPSGSRVPHKNNIPKVMFIVATARQDPSRGFDGQVGIWHVCIMETDERSSKRQQQALGGVRV